jgi:gluconate 2-dehydrogenase gamma chain
MAGQSIERREILRILTVAASAAAFPGFSKWSFACGHIANLATQIRPATYALRFFNEPEYALVERLTDIIIPSDATPGAREAGVSEFIDLMVSRDLQMQGQFRNGLAWLKSHSETTQGSEFLKLAPLKQIAVLEPLAYKAKFRTGDAVGRDFFTLFREFTVMGFYSSEIGLKELDYPGLKFYDASPACPHLDDPEHLHLPPPKW